MHLGKNNVKTDFEIEDLITWWKNNFKRKIHEKDKGSIIRSDLKLGGSCQKGGSQSYGTRDQGCFIERSKNSNVLKKLLFWIVKSKN